MVAQQEVTHRLVLKGMDEEARTFTGLASTWNVDVEGDLILRGAFAESLAEWRKGERMLPLLDSHNAYSSVENVIGRMIEGKETKEGLLATFELMPDDAKAAAVYRRLKGGYVNGLSIGFSIRGWEKPTDEERMTGVWRKITKVDLMEVSVVVWPANEGSRVAAVKAAMAGVNPERLSPEEQRELRILGGQIGYLLRAASAARGEDAGASDGKESEDDGGATGDPPRGALPPVDDAGVETKGDDEPAPAWQLEAVAARLTNLRLNRKGE